MQRQLVPGYSGRRLLGILSAAIAIVIASICASTSSASTTKSSGRAVAAKALPPIKIGVGVVVIPGVYDAEAMYAPGVKAALAYTKAQGGWGGRRVQTIQCVSAGDPASDTACYREFISDGAVAVIGILPGSATIGYPLLSKVGIPSFMIGASRGDDTSPWENNISGSAASSFTSAARYACANHAKNVSVMHDDTAAATSSFELYAAKIYSRCGIQVNLVPVPYGTADMAPYITKAVETKPDLLDAMATAPGATLAQGITSAGFPLSKTLMPGGGTPTAAENGVTFVSGWEQPLKQNTNPQIKTFLKYMGTASPGSDPDAQLTLPAFQDITTIWQVGQAIGFAKLTGRSLQKYMNTKAVGHLQIFGSLDVSIDTGSPGVKQPFSNLSQWKNGKFVDLGWWQANTPCRSVKTCAKGHVPAS
jgi:branched-chain amino acid transport system substrate-binding protein